MGQLGGQLNDLTDRLNHLTPDFPTHRQRIDDLMERGSNLLANTIAYKKEQVSGLDGRLKALNPSSVLERGYSILTDAGGHPIISISQIKQGDLVRGRVNDGSFEAEVLS